MASENRPSKATVDFPTCDSTQATSLSPNGPDNHIYPAPYLPFRRISLPSAPNLNHRLSVVSTASFDSMPEVPHVPVLVSTPKGVARGLRNRPSSVEAARRNQRRRETKSVVVDEQREAKRRKVINELHETERTYVDALELIYSHFLTPIVASLDTPNQLLDRAELTSIFSNFIDIWNLHRSFYTSLTSLLNASTSTSTEQEPPALSPVLLAHFPYLSLYTPFVSSFPDALSSYTALLVNNQAFASFMTAQEADPRCGKLKFRDWLLTIVQRCPRYLLLLKDLIGSTNPENPEYTSLTAVHSLVSKITDSLNASLHTHAQTLSLLAIQRSTANLPFQLVTPGRTFLKRGPLLQVIESTPKEREFLLFSDCIVWLSSADKADDADRLSRWEMLERESGVTEGSTSRPTISRTRSRSEAELSQTAGVRKRDSRLRLKLAGPARKKRQSSAGGEDKWVYKGHIDLVDLEIVVGPPREVGEQRRLEVLSPRKSFALYAFTEEERDEWCTAIRNAKAVLLVSLNVMHPNSTLTSSASTNHLRHALQAMPYSPDEEQRQPKRGRVEHFVPAIWIPDSKTESCMRCGRTFGWRRRRHHCRLCGRCVCSSCSNKTFFIRDASPKGAQKSARACDACYEAVFPVLDTAIEPQVPMTTISHLTISGLRSMPSLLLDHNANTSPSVLMAVDMENSRRPLSRIDAGSSPSYQSREPSDSAIPAVRIRPPPRPRSYIQILEDFHMHGEPSPMGSPTNSRFSGRADDMSFVLDEREEDEERESQAHLSGEASPAHDPVSSPEQASPSVSLPLSVGRNEDTVRRRKRFSMPAVAIHTTPVTARPNMVGEGKSRRWSLVLGNWKGGGHATEFADTLKHGAAATKLSELLGRHSKPQASP